MGSSAAARIGNFEISHFGSSQIDKYPWEVDAWEKDFGKLPSIIIY